MRSVGDELAAALLGAVQALGKVVEFPRKRVDLVMAAQLDLVAVIALAHIADGLQDAAQTARKRCREKKREHHDRNLQADGNAQDVRLQRGNDRGTLGVILDQIHGPQNFSAGHERHCRPRLDGFTVVAAMKYVVAL